jgi:hypothetical protein
MKGRGYKYKILKDLHHYCVRAFMEQCPPPPPLTNVPQTSVFMFADFMISSVFINIRLNCCTFSSSVNLYTSMPVISASGSVGSSNSDKFGNGYHIF